MRTRYLLPLFSFVLISFVTLSTSARTITYNNDPTPKEQYMVDVLKLAIKKSGADFHLKPTPEVFPEAKVRADLEAGSIDIYWGAATKGDVKKFRPVYVPLVKGLLGYRLFIIKQDSQATFNRVDSLATLKQLVAGQGHFWGDTPILANAGLPVETAVKYENLFHMLEGERFDYFPRAAHEPWSEVASHRELGLSVEKNLLLAYPLAMIFYVNKEDEELATVLTNGLERAIADGSFDDYFFNSPLIQSALSKSQISSRTIFNINNPYLPEGIPLDRKEFWLDVDKLHQQAISSASLTYHTESR